MTPCDTFTFPSAGTGAKLIRLPSQSKIIGHPGHYLHGFSSVLAGPNQDVPTRPKEMHGVFFFFGQSIGSKSLIPANLGSLTTHGIWKA